MRHQFSFLTIFFLLITIGLKAQLNVGSTAAPDASAGLQVSTTGKGFMPPKLSLTATNVFGLTGSSNTVGMIVYNTNASLTTAGNYPSYGTGLYMWDGTGWLWQGPLPTLVAYAPITTVPATGASVGATFSTTAALKTSAIAPSVSGSAITFNTTGTYKVDIEGYGTPSAITSATLAGKGYVVSIGGSITLVYTIPIPESSGGNIPFHISFYTSFTASNTMNISLSNSTSASANITLSSVSVQLLHN